MRRVALVLVVCMAYPGFAAELVVQFPETGQSSLIADSVRGLLEAFCSEPLPERAEAKLTLKKEKVNPVLLEELGNPSGSIAAASIYSLFKRSRPNYDRIALAYWVSSMRLHSDFQLPNSLVELETALNFKDWEKEVVENSAVKGLTRILYRSPKSAPASLSIAQTVESQGNRVRETEIILKRKDFEQWDFYAYDEMGKPATTSLFLGDNGKQIRGPIPTTCHTCHHNPLEGNFTPDPIVFRQRKK